MSLYDSDEIFEDIPQLNVYKQVVPRVYVGNVYADAVNNKHYRHVLNTTPNGFQTVLMTLKPNETIDGEYHPNTEQSFYIIKGRGIVIYGDQRVGNIDSSSTHKQSNFKTGFLIDIPKNTYHKIINTDPNENLYLFTTYSNPQHEQGYMEVKKPEVESFSKK